MTAGPSFAVVVPTWNEEQALPGLLERLTCATESADRADQVIVTDGGSADRTVELARAGGAEVVVGARGRGSQLALGARGARADVLWFLHADTCPRSGSLAELRRVFADPDCLAAGCRQHIVDPARIFRWIEGASNLRVRRLGIVYGDAGLAVRRELYEELGGFRPLPVFEDLDLARRVRRRARPRWVGNAVLEVSARRWRRDGVLLQTARNWILTAAWFAGVPAERLARHYPPNTESSS